MKGGRREVNVLWVPEVLKKVDPTPRIPVSQLSSFLTLIFRCPLARILKFRFAAKKRTRLRFRKMRNVPLLRANYVEAGKESLRPE